MNPVKTAVDRRLANARLPESAYTLPEKPRRRPFRPVRLAVAAALCGLLLLGAAGAIGTALLPEEARAHLAALFGTEDSRFDVVGAACVRNGVRVTLDGLYASGRELYAVFTAVREDGEPFAEDASFLTFRKAENNLSSLWKHAGSSWGPKEPGNLREMRFVTHFVGQERMDCAGETAVFTFRDIMTARGGAADELLVRGKWTVQAPLARSEPPAYARAGQVVSCGDVRVTVEELAFTPVSVSILLSFDREIQYRETPDGGPMQMLLDGEPAPPGSPDPYDVCYGFTLTDTAGRVYPIQTAGVTLQDGSFYCSGLMERTIPVEELAAATLYGQTIPLEWIR